jgi:hypothetical protein
LSAETRRPSANGVVIIVAVEDNGFNRSPALWTELRESVSLIPNTSGGNGAASFGHIMGGYDGWFRV